MELIGAHLHTGVLLPTGLTTEVATIPTMRWLVKFGKTRIVKYQYSQPGQKVKWMMGSNRFLVHRTEVVMSDIFTAIKRRDIFPIPRWERFEEPFASKTS